MTYLAAQLDAVRRAMPFGVSGQWRHQRVDDRGGGSAVPSGPCAGSIASGEASIAEVIGFATTHPADAVVDDGGRGAGRSDREYRRRPAHRLLRGLLGRVLNGFGQPMDGKGRFAR